MTGPHKHEENLYADLRRHTSGERIDLNIVTAQNERHVTVTVTLTERPPRAGRGDEREFAAVIEHYDQSGCSAHRRS